MSLQTIAQQHGLELDSSTSPLPLQTLHRPPAEEDHILRLYLDGDGTPWQNGAPARNPTTAGTPLGLRLFLRDPAAHAYLGRPCYFLQPPLPAVCDAELWTSHRYSAQVVAALGDEIRQLAQRHDLRRVELIGYSGGGTLALLLAASLPEVEKVVTLAAPLDVHGWTAFHRLLPLSGSLSPLTAARTGKAVERHFVGSRDRVVPPSLAGPYLKRNPDASLHVIDGFDHRCCWESYWPALLHTAE